MTGFNAFALTGRDCSNTRYPGQAQRHPGYLVLEQSRPVRAKALNVRFRVSPDNNNSLCTYVYRGKRRKGGQPLKAQNKVHYSQCRLPLQPDGALAKSKAAYFPDARRVAPIRGCVAW